MTDKEQDKDINKRLTPVGDLAIWRFGDGSTDI